MKPRRITSKILSPAQATKKASAWRRNGNRVVFTNGCFDLLHQGHVRYLERARRLGDILIVALNTDASVRKIKGPKRPLNPLAARMEVLAALECVDGVTWFEEETPLRLIVGLKPKFVAKGGDWKASKIVGGREAKTWGGKAVSLPYLEGRSTTALIRRASRG